MKLYSWSEWNESSSEHELHGDLELSLDFVWAETISFGFCFGFDSLDKWDCLGAETGINADRILRDSLYASSFGVADMSA